MALPELGTAAEIVTIATGTIAGGFGLRRWLAGRKRVTDVPAPLTLELAPTQFELYVGEGSIPRVTVLVRAINYDRKPMTLTEVRVRHLQIEQIGTLEEIRLPDPVELHPRTSAIVYCRRTLLDSEAAMVRSRLVPGQQRGSAMVLGRGRIGRREVSFDHLHALAVVGSVEGLPVPQLPPASR